MDSEGIAPNDLQGAALASVVPQLTQAWCAALHRMLGIDALVCTAASAGELFPTTYANPGEIGADVVFGTGRGEFTLDPTVFDGQDTEIQTMFYGADS